jgi:hypothetical protein
MNKSAVQQILKDAQEAVEGSGVDKELRPVAFDKAVDLIAGVPKATPPTNGGGGGGGGGSGDRAGGAVGDKAQKIAKKMGIDAEKLAYEKLAYVYDLEDEDVSLIVKRSPSPVAKQTAHERSRCCTPLRDRPVATTAHTRSRRRSRSDATTWVFWTMRTSRRT